MARDDKIVLSSRAFLLPEPESLSRSDQRLSSSKPRSITYADAGVDIDRANRTKQRIKYLAHKTFTRGVLSEIGGFGGLFAIDRKRYRDPVLVSSVDGVGTKLKLAFEMQTHHTIGADLVNHCVNDIAVQGATPLFFMDYLATGHLDPEVAEKVVEGIAEACRHNGCALIGNELMRTHKSYWPVLRKLIDAEVISALAHITGGGITENLPRVLPKHLGAAVELNSWPVLPIFEHLQKLGNVPHDDMLRTFNMGIGMVLVVPVKKFKKVQTILERCGEKGYTIGRIVKGEHKVSYA